MASEGKKKIRVGVVVSNAMDKTAVVLVERKIRHSKYLKTLKVSNRLKVHDEKNALQPGDQVRIIETRPLSKGKNWRVLDASGDKKN
ncbi:MAG: 30S ribosomal protein S17 [Nitrospinota bacterium]